VPNPTPATKYQKSPLAIATRAFSFADTQGLQAARLYRNHYGILSNRVEMSRHIAAVARSKPALASERKRR
jgi:hypothetical protein